MAIGRGVCVRNLFCKKLYHQWREYKSPYDWCLAIVHHIDKHLCGLIDWEEQQEKINVQIVFVADLPGGLKVSRSSNVSRIGGLWWVLNKQSRGRLRARLRMRLKL